MSEQFALLVGAASFVGVLSDPQSSYEVEVQLPDAWQGCWSGMPSSGSNFIASDYETLLDCPIVAGNGSVREFEFDHKPHRFVTVGDFQAWDMDRAEADVRKIIAEHHAMWKAIPYESYTLLNLITGGKGGLEHRNSMVIMADRLSMRTRKSYVAWLDLISHEYFHVWNVKRLRPVELGPLDYEHEVYTRNLWIAEGFTEYYGLLALRRSDLISNEEFLGTSRPPGERNGSLSSLIEQLQTTPGRLQQPVSVASFDAWIKLYRLDENSVNSTISYYTKGAVIAWLLDARIRAASGGLRTLDDVMQLAFERHSGARGFTGEEFRSIAGEVGGTDLHGWFARAVDSTEELDYVEALGWFGLRFEAARVPGQEVQKGWAGFSTKSENGRLIVSQVPRDSAAWQAGVTADDEILGIDNYRVRADQWNLMMDQYRPDMEIVLLISRRDRLLNVTVRLAAEPMNPWRLSIDPDATPEQQQHFASWVCRG